MFEPSEVLDDEQLAAATAPERSIVVLAGPGSGKTRTLSQRSRWLLHETPGSRALLLTFTNKAAAEMKKRALAASAVPSDRVLACTFHSFGVRLLRAHGAEVGIPPELTILDQEGADQLAAAVAEREGLADFSEQWSGTRITLREPTPLVSRFAAAYEAEKRSLGVVDFDDLIVYTAELLRTNEGVASAYGGRFGHILIDEFQDTDPAQFALIRALEPYAQTISAFADDDQAIFSFRGANPGHIPAFIEALGARHYDLTVNYRSRTRIVEVANALILSDDAGSRRSMSAVRGGGDVGRVEFSDEAGEARWLSEKVQALLTAGVEPGEIAVLGPSGPRLGRVAAALAETGIPTTVWFGASPRSESLEKLSTCLTVLRRRLLPPEAKALCTLVDAEDAAEEVLDILTRGERAVVVGHLQELRELAFGGGTPGEIVLKAKAALEAVPGERAGVIDDLVDVVDEWAREDPEFSLDHLLTELALGNTGSAVRAEGGVKVATIHRTKGLEWPYVFLVGLEQETLPRFSSLTGLALSEQRRMCFVAVARAMDALTLSRCETVRGFSKAPSQFLSEMLPEA